MITKIGIVAGEVWEYLEKNDRKAGFDDILRDLDAERDMLLLSIGWLARESHVVLDWTPPNFTVELA